MAHVELYEERKPAEMTRWRTFWLSLADRATWVVASITIFCDDAPVPFVLFVVFMFVTLCNTVPTAAVLTGAMLWWFLMMTTGRWTLRSIVATALIVEIYRALFAPAWFPSNPLKA